MSYPESVDIVLKDIDFYVFSKYSLRQEKNIAKWLIQYQLSEIKYFERYQFLQRYLFLTLWLVIYQGQRKQDLRNVYKIFKNALNQDPKSKEEKFSSMQKNQILALLNILNLIDHPQVENQHDIIQILCMKSCSIHLQVLMYLIRKKIKMAISLYCREKFFIEALILSKLFGDLPIQVCQKMAQVYKDKNKMIYQKVMLYIKCERVVPELKQ